MAHHFSSSGQANPFSHLAIPAAFFQSPAVAAPGHFLQQAAHGSDSGHGHVQLCQLAPGKCVPALDAGGWTESEKQSADYERIGILVPAERVSGQRRYDATVLQRLAVIQRARQTGFTWSMNE